MPKHLVVLDTNIILVSISRNSPHNWVFKKLLNEEYTICVSTEILLEYAEILERRMGSRASEALMGIFEHSDNVKYINTYFEFQLLDDPDDNKFVDCAIAANAHYIVSHDKDFKVLKEIDFPKVEVIDIKEFKTRLDNN